MPIEIRELIITATVEEQGAGGEAAAATPGATSPEDKQQIIQECVDQILEILKKEDRR